MSPAELEKSKLWWNGPPWLSDYEGNWPHFMTIPIKPVEIEEEIPLISIVTTPKVPEPFPFIEPSKFSSWHKLLRATIYALRFLKLKVGSSPLLDSKLPFISKLKPNGNFSPVEYSSAEKFLISLDQTSREPNSTKPLKTIKDKEGICRLSSRIINSNTPFTFKCPIILPKLSQLAKLIIIDIHTSLLHAGVDSTLTKFLSKFWSPKARKLVKEVINHCPNCQKMKSYPYSFPEMPPLPDSRVCRQIPFQFIGLDYLGPTVTSKDDKIQKAWILLLTCLTTRAVYLEPTTSLKSENFLHIFRRFVSRRGKPVQIISDNGTTFNSS